MTKYASNAVVESSALRAPGWRKARQPTPEKMAPIVARGVAIDNTRLVRSASNDKDEQDNKQDEGLRESQRS
jgi:hypothetical protein